MPVAPGIHDLEAARYYSDGLDSEPSLNGTVLKALIGASPLHAWTAHPKLNPDYRESTDKKFDVGSAAHELFLLNDDSRVAVADFPDWRTKAAQAVRDVAREERMIPLLAGQWQEVARMLAALREQLPLIHADPPLFVAGKPERTLVWRDHDVLCRARLDWLHDSLECCDDLKTAARSANPHAWARTTMWGIGADIQAAFTLRGLRAALGVESTFRFVLAETHAPYAISVVTPSEQALTLSNAKIDAGLEKWKRCLAEDDWPSYAPHVHVVDPPPWIETQWYEAQAVDEQIDELGRAA